MLKQTTTFLNARIVKSELELNQAMQIAKINLQQGMMALKGTVNLEGQKLDKLERSINHNNSPHYLVTPSSLTGVGGCTQIRRFIICSIKESRQPQLIERLRSH